MADHADFQVRLSCVAVTMDLPGSAAVRPDAMRRLLWNAALFTAGHVLTSGGFLTYFAAELGAKSVEVAWLLTLPELAGTAGLISQPLCRTLGRRSVWRWASAVSLASLACVPAIAIVDSANDGHRLSVLMAMIGISSAARGIGFVALFAWMTSLVPDHRWSRFFSGRNIAHVAVMLALAPLGGFLRDWAKASGIPFALQATNGGTFGLGGLLLLLATVVLWHLPEAWPTPDGNPRASLEARAAVLRDPVLRRLIFFSWWHAFASGLTQAAFYQFRIGPLGIGLGTFYLLEAGMRIVQIPVSHLAGLWGDRYGHCRVLTAGVVAAGSSLVFWMLASREAWCWLWPAYLLFGGWAAVNISGPTLLLRLSPGDKHPAAIALFQNIAGLLAGLAGLLGGYWLDRLLRFSDRPVDAYRVVFAVSLVGRLMAAGWLRGIPVAESSRPRPCGPDGTVPGSPP